MVLNRTPPPTTQLVWRFRFADDGEYTLGFDGQAWIVDPLPPDKPADLVIDTTTQAWAQLLLTPPERRRPADQGVDVQGSPADIQRFAELLARFPKGAAG